MALILFTSDTKATEFGRLTPVDAELDSVVLDLFYLTCLVEEYGSKAGAVYRNHYEAVIEKLAYQNPFDVVALLKNVSKGSAEFILSRTLFYRQECEKREAEAEKKKAEAQAEHQSVISKKLDNLDKAHKLRQRMIKDGIDIEEASKIVGGLLVDQRAELILLNKDRAK